MCPQHHTYLGMMLDYSTPGQVKISMFDYMEEILTAFNKAEPKGAGMKSSTALDNLFKINIDCEKLKTGKAIEFHSLIVKMLYATKCTHPDMYTSIAFLTMCVHGPDLDD